MPHSRSTISLLAAAFAAGALFLSPAGGALAHGHHNGSSSSGGDLHHTISGNHHRHYHHHHHHGSGPLGTGPVHGPGSSHNPIVYHPKHGPGSSHNPIIAPVTVVRDHRRPPSRAHPGGGSRYLMCQRGILKYCSPDHVRDHRTPSGTQCLGNLC